ncbi:MAG: response regulator [Candidatus Rokuibacteriota bacterium]
MLVVEDQVDLGDVFRDFLVELGHHPLVVHTAEAALARLQTERLDAILLDVHLPGMSGLDFLQLRPVRALGVPIVAVSGVANESQARECLRLGAADFMTKPVQLDRLNEVLTFLEPHAMSRAAELERQPDKRRSTRARVALPVRLCEYNGREHDGTLIEVGLAGMKVRFGAALGPDTIGRAIFTPPDTGRPIEVIAILVRVDPDGQAFTFVRLDPRDAERLRDLIRRQPA